jgi:hypothetical protein
MKTVHLAGLAGLAAIAVPEACAQVYAGGGYTAFTYERTETPTFSGVTDDLTFGAVTGRVGYQVNPFFAMEAEASFGVSGGGEAQLLGLPPSVPAQYASIDLGNTFGGFAVAKLPIPMVGDLFARAGIGNIEVDANPGTGLGQLGGGGAAYGAGVEINMFAMLRGRVEYTLYDIDEGFDAISASLLMKF